MGIKPVGGRGKKAPYKTITIRIPEEVEEIVEILSDKYREKVLRSYVSKDKILGFTIKTKQEAIEIKDLILKSRKSAKYSLERFIDELYS